jgi:hypothetical protein
VGATHLPVRAIRPIVTFGTHVDRAVGRIERGAGVEGHTGRRDRRLACRSSIGIVSTTSRVTWSRVRRGRALPACVGWQGSFGATCAKSAGREPRYTPELKNTYPHARRAPRSVIYGPSLGRSSGQARCDVPTV